MEWWKGKQEMKEGTLEYGAEQNLTNVKKK